MAIDDHYFVFFDIDNTLYPASSNISHAMSDLIHKYFVDMGFDDEEASKLHLEYYTQYGLALRGLVRHHQIDPLDFDRKCDGALPLEEMIFPDPAVRKLFEDIDRGKARIWGLTNAYRYHAERVLKILNLSDLVEGIIYCDYAQENFVCKPEEQYYHDALKTANVSDPSRCYFIDDNRANVDVAKRLGWGHCVHFCERGREAVWGGKKKVIGDSADDLKHENGVIPISDLRELRTVWPEIFKQS